MKEEIHQDILEDFMAQIGQWLDVHLEHYMYRAVEIIEGPGYCARALIYVMYYESVPRKLLTWSGNYEKDLELLANNEPIERFVSANVIIKCRWKNNLYLSPEFWTDVEDRLIGYGVTLRPR